MSFAKMKASRKKSLAQLNTELEKLNSGGSQQQNQVDDRFWKPTVDKVGNGYAVIRFLPAPDGESVPFVRLFTHGFKGPTGSWYIENSRTTLGEQDPVGEYNAQLWNSGDPDDKTKAREQKRRLHFISNILVEKDPGNPENEGKVFLYKYGKKIFDKLNDLMNPQFEDEEPVNPFDFWDGASFKLKIRQVEGYRNYDKSEFAAPKALSEDEDELEGLYNSLHSLEQFIAPDQFKSYAELKEKLERVLSGTPVVQMRDETPFKEDVEPEPKMKQVEEKVVDVEDDDEFAELMNSLK
jgi:hypothetical protein